MHAATTEPLFLQKRLNAPLKYPTGLVSSFLSCVKSLFSTNLNFSAGMSATCTLFVSIIPPFTVVSSRGLGVYRLWASAANAARPNTAEYKVFRAAALPVSSVLSAETRAAQRQRQNTCAMLLTNNFTTRATGNKRQAADKPSVLSAEARVRLGKRVARQGSVHRRT